MKKVRLLAMVFTLGLMLSVLASCGDDEETVESCSEEEICTAKNVTACCDNAVCVYKFDGKEYSEDQLEQLADDLGCSGSSSGRIDATAAHEQLIGQLKALVEKSRAQLN